MADHRSPAPGRTARAGLIAVLVAALFTAAACGGSGSNGGAGSNTDPDSGSRSSTTAPRSTTSDGAAAGAPVASAGCRAGATPPVTHERRDLPVAELTRWYLLTVPPAADGAATASDATPMPLVLDFHGLTEGAEVHADLDRLGEEGIGQHFVTVVPQGSGDLARWAVGPGGDATAPNDDLDFVVALLNRVTDDVCIDTSRVYATGLSNGAMLTSLIACRLAGRFAAVAPIAGATDFDGCAPTRAVPMLTIHGTADPILLFNGGVGDIVKLLSGSFGDAAAGGGATASTTTAPTTTTAPVDLNGAGYPANVRAWAERNGCDPTPTDSAVSASVTHRVYRCPRGADVEMYIVAGGGHAWPGSELSRNLAGLLGPTTFDIDATKLVWDFFRRFRLG